jgi:hypothetical protein
MNYNLVFLLITCLILVLLSSWSVNTFARLKSASKNYDNFDSVCHLSREYVNTGLSISIFSFVFSFLLMVATLFLIIKSNLGSG